MRNSSIKFFVTLFIGTACAVLALFLFQRLWLKTILNRLNSSQTLGLPTSTTPISNFSIPTAPHPVSLGKEVIVNDLGITVTRVISPADSYVGKAGFSSVPREGKEYLVVDIKVRCVSSGKKCHIIEFDFGVETQSGHNYPAELSGNYSDDLQGVFEGGDIEPGKNMSGSLIFILLKGEKRLTLIYPRMFAFGGSAKFVLGK